MEKKTHMFKDLRVETIRLLEGSVNFYELGLGNSFLE